MPEERNTKSQRQAAAREKARIEREEHLKKQKRRRIAIQSGVVVGIIAVAIVIVVFVVNIARPGTSSVSAGPQNMISDGIVIGADLVAVRTGAITASTAASDQAASTPNRLVVYLDYQCPNCADFEATNNSQIEQWVTSGEVTLEIRPLSFLDKSSQNEYSSRAANAAACVANYEPDKFFAFNTAMFANQPSEGTAGPSNSEINALIQSVTGSTSSELSSCVTGGTFSGWVADATKRGIGSPNKFGLTVTGTPGVFFNGQAVTGAITTDATVLAAAVSSAIGS